MPEVTIYTTPTCSFCHIAKRFFKENKIEYNEIDVAEDQEKARQMVDLSGQMGVPVIVIKKEGREKVIIGFDEGKIRKELGL